VEVRVCEIQIVVTAFALAAGRVRILAENGLREPECESLFADSARAVKQKARGDCARFEGSFKAISEILVAVEASLRHILIWHVS
jgi:hypothetical protein